MGPALFGAEWSAVLSVFGQCTVLLQAEEEQTVAAVAESTEGVLGSHNATLAAVHTAIQQGTDCGTMPIKHEMLAACTAVSVVLP